MYLLDAEVKHLLFVAPSQWEGMTAVALGNITVHPLLAVPITEGELTYVRKNGADALETLWEDSGCDVLDLRRNGAV